MKTLYIIHEEFDWADLNDLEVTTDLSYANKLFAQLREKHLNESGDERYAKPIDIYRNEVDDLYLRNSLGDDVRIYITEHTIQ